MITKNIKFKIDDVIITAELYVEKAPLICNWLLENIGQTAIIQHAKLNGQLIFGTLPFTCGFENKVRGGDLVEGELAYYPPRNQLCFLYGQGTDEPLPISKIGRIVDGLEELKVIGIKNWLHQGSIMTILSDEE